MKTVDWLFKLIIFFLLKLVLIAILIHLFFFLIQNKKDFALYVLNRDNNFLKSIYKIYTAK